MKDEASKLNPDAGQEYLTAMSELDNPIWSALTTIHALLAEGDELARRYPAEINTLAGIVEASPLAFASLAEFTKKNETVALFLDKQPQSPSGWELVRTLALVQMVWLENSVAAVKDVRDVLLLSAPDSADMVALGQLTNPGPIGRRTHEIGDFIGLRDSTGKLIAMAGERLRFPGYSEISGVCTHPDRQGQGLAAALVMRGMGRISGRGEVPFLHARADNIRAIRLYERLGFETRRTFQLVILRRV